MARRSPKKKPKSRGGKRRLAAALDAVGAWPWPTIRRASIAAAWLAGIALLAGAWIIGVPRLENTVADIAWRQDVTVEFENLPKWVNGDLLAMLELTARGQLSGDPLAPHELAAVRYALLETGWFESVRQVRRTRADRISVTATFARPFAVIRDRQGDHLVDPTGRLLPRSYGRGQAEQFVVIDGVHFDRPQRPGVQWEGADVTAALRLLRLIDTRSWAHQVSAIDAGDFLSRESLTLVTEHGTNIIWGSAPGAEAPGEATAERKLTYLDYQAEHMGHINRGYDGDLDVTSPDGVFAR